MKSLGEVMSRDFTLTKYGKLLETINDAGYTTTTVYDYLKNSPSKCVILRHDVDREAGRALEMARLEYDFGIKSTYYFRHKKNVFNPEIIADIANMGHEIGFHYEVMDKAKGDKVKAIEIFKKELNDFHKIASINTICMHGNPFAPWSNRDLWLDYSFKSLGIIGEPYLSIDYKKVLYLTDTGRTWADLNIRVKDVVNNTYEGTSSKFLRKVSSTDDISALIQSEKVPLICILVHPNRWCNDLFGWGKELVLQNVKNIGKAGIIWYRGNKA